MSQLEPGRSVITIANCTKGRGQGIGAVSYLPRRPESTESRHSPEPYRDRRSNGAGDQGLSEQSFFRINFKTEPKGWIDTKLPLVRAAQDETKLRAVSYRN